MTDVVETPVVVPSKKLTKVDVLKNPNLNATIDLKVSFKDILDMVIAEEEQVYEQRLADIEKERKVVRKRAEAITYDDVRAEVEALGRKYYRNQIKSLEVLFGRPAWLDKYTSNSVKVTSRGVMNRHDVKDDFGVEVPTTVKFVFGDKDDGDDKNCATLTYHPGTKNIPSIVKIQELCQQLGRLNDVYEVVEEEMNGLRRRAKTLKAASVRKILESSTEGKQVLSVVGSKEQIKLLLTGDAPSQVKDV